MKLLYALGLVALAGCSKAAPAPATLVGTWNLDQLQVVTVANAGGATTAGVTSLKNLQQQEIYTPDGRMIRTLAGAQYANVAYTYQAPAIIYTSQQGTKITLQVQLLTDHQLVYVDTFDNGTTTQTSTTTLSR